MAKNAYDVVVIGAGHNGLVVAAYLLKAGLDVCVIESYSKVGGGAITSEVTIPGFKFDLGSACHYGIQGNPVVRFDELGLKSKYGLKYLNPEHVTAFVFPDDSSLVVYMDINKTCESIARFSRKDAEAWPRFCKAAAQTMKAGNIAMSGALPPMGKVLSFLDGSEEGREYWRVFLSSCLDIVSEWFESREVRAAICRYACDYMASPREYGTGFNAISGLALIQNWGLGLPVGGSGALSEALAAYIRDNGGTLRLSTPVKSVIAENGEAKGVVLQDGEEIRAKKAVVSNANVKQLFLQMLRPGDLPPGFQGKVERLKHSRYSYINYFLAINEAPKYVAGGDVNRTASVAITPYLDDMLRIMDEIVYGVPKVGLPFVTVHSMEDHTRAPAGKHALSLLHFAPYNLKEGGAGKWDETKQAVADNILSLARKHITNLAPQNILGQSVMSPLDIERYNPAMMQGDVLHLAHIPSQYFSHRPLPGWGQYKTPVKKLYMCGASTHPGGGVTGGGRVVAQVVMEDLGMDFRKVGK
ncbi:MAG: NAD(P)/FAD-dependent oxidoreductase [Chloroflexi bacterium]|nr:NAD(P)/FAD-dependent oxidoreductase [Chloroflexota bacterium]